MRVFLIPLLSLVRGLIRKAPSSRFYVVPAALDRTNPSISHSEQVKEGNFDCDVLELNEIGVLRVLNTMKDDPFLALSFLKRIEGNGSLPSLQAYAAVIRIVCGCGLDQKLDPFFVELIRKGDEGRGFTVMDLFNAIGEAEEEGEESLLLLSSLSSAFVKAYANLEMFDEAIDIFFQTSPLGCGPDIKALNLMMNRMIASGKNSMAMASFLQIERLGLDADAHIYVLMVQALHRNEDIKGLEKFLRRLFDSETRKPCLFYMTFIEGLCLNKMSGIAYLLLQLLREANILVDKSDLGISYHRVVRGLCKEMNIEDAEKVVLDMEELGIDPHVYVYSAIIEGHRKNMNIPKALDVFCKMMEKNVRINRVIVSSVLQCICQMGKFSEAYFWFEKFREMNISLDRVCYNVAFDALGKLGKVEEAIELFREMTGKGIAPDVINYTTLIGGCCLQGKCSEASHLMTEMESTGKTPDIIIYNVLAGGLARNDLAEKACETLKRMEDRGVNPTSVTHSMVIEGFFAAGRIDKAEAFYKSLEHRSRENDVSMVKGYVEAGWLDQAYERFITLEFPLPKSVYFTLFTSLCAQKDYISKAQDLLDRMWELGVEPEKSMYGRLIGAWCRVNNVRKARQFFKILVTKEIIPDLFTYTNMINTYCRLNELKQANALFQDMKRKNVKPDVVTYTVLLNSISEVDVKMEMEASNVKPDVVYYTVLIDQQCKIQDLQKAERIFVEMIDSGLKPDAMPYTALIACCFRNGSVHKAVTLMQEMSEKKIEPTEASVFIVHYARIMAKILR